MSLLWGWITERGITFSDILILLFSVSGIIWGYVLGLIAPEELGKSKKYFVWANRIMLGLILILVDYHWYGLKEYLLLIIFTVLIIFLFLMEIVFIAKRKVYQLLIYFLILISFFLISDLNFRLILASMIFGYNLISGTLLKRVVE
ncbi:MAG TPA: hypothetical protein VJA23_01545 [Candidatus Nanoarchaeia archaeon]|nr:hypothetical protein [Candidatus Nanoarchaeia archaeon]